MRLMNSVRESLERGGFIVSEYCDIRPSCFDLAARREKIKVLVKVVLTLGSISHKTASELKHIAVQLRATPLLVSLYTAKEAMEDDAVYTRYDIYAVTPNTLVNAVEKDVYPLVEARPGGYFSHLDGEAIRERRLELRMSIGELAKMINASRRTVYNYERSGAMASVDVAIKLAEVLEIPVAKQIRFLEKPPFEEGEAPPAQSERVAGLLAKVVEKLGKMGFFTSVTEKAPFDFIASNEEISEERIIGGVAEKADRNAGERIRETSSVAEVTESNTVFVIEDAKLLKDIDAPAIEWKEFKHIEKPEELIENIHSYK